VAAVGGGIGRSAEGRRVREFAAVSRRGVEPAVLALEAKGVGKSRLWRREIMSRVFTYLSPLSKRGNSSSDGPAAR